MLHWHSAPYLGQMTNSSFNYNLFNPAWFSLKPPSPRIAHPAFDYYKESLKKNKNTQSKENLSNAEWPTGLPIHDREELLLLGQNCSKTTKRKSTKLKESTTQTNGVLKADIRTLKAVRPFEAIQIKWKQKAWITWESKPSISLIDYRNKRRQYPFLVLAIY